MATSTKKKRNSLHSKTDRVAQKKLPAFTPTRGRPTADQAVAISRTILSAATERFLADGYERTAMETIAAAAGVPKSTLYKRYPNKLSLLRAVVEDRVSTWSSVSSQKNLALPGDIEVRLKRHAESVLLWAASEEVRSFTRLASGAGEGPPEAAKALLEFGYTGMVDVLEREIREHGGDTVKDARGVAVALMTMLCGWLAMRSPGLSIAGKEATTFARKSVELLMKGKAAW